MNLLGGTFSTVVHAHEHERAAVDHHDQEREIDHIASGQQAAGLPADPQSDGEYVDGNRHVHEHHAEIVLATFPSDAVAIDRVGRHWAWPLASFVTGRDAAPGERPPCAS